MKRGLRSVVVCLGSLAALLTAAVWQGLLSQPGEADKPVPPLQDTSPRFWKGNLHTHSLWSDGDDFPEMIADWYKRHGYHFLALSDHNILSEGERWSDVGPEDGPRAQALKKYRARFGTHWVEERQEEGKAQVRLKPLREFRSVLEEPGRFLLIPAEEITHRFAKLPVHLNAINLRDKIEAQDGDSVAETIRANLRAVADQRKRTGWRTLVFLNHPNYGWGVRAEDMAAADELQYFEVFNGHPSVRNYGDPTHAACERVWDILLALRLGKHQLPVVYGLATDDAHGYHAFGVGKVNPGRSWVMIRAPYLSAEAMVRGLEAGDFYASTGVVLDDVRRDGDTLRLAIRGEKGVTYKTQFIATARDASLDSEPLTDKDGKPLDVTRRYGTDVGKVVAESEDLNPSYRLTGKEWYVRAKVVSSKPHPNPYEKGDVEVAWTQPVVP
jgi:hypothetical protein